MSSNTVPQPKSITRNPLLYSSIVIGIALLFAGYVLFSRKQENRAIERQREADS